MKAISLFSGAGGLDCGFIWAGFDIIWAIDNWSDAVETYRRNIGGHIICADICNVDVSAVPDADIVIGGFPCQGFSIANMKRSETDGRNQLYVEFIKILRANKPRFFVAENVRGILNLAEGNVFKAILNDFYNAGYDVTHALLNAAYYGVPQRRERVFIFGVREDVDADLSAFPPTPTHLELDKAQHAGKLPWVSIGKALEMIPEPSEDHQLTNHDYTKYKLLFNGYIGNRTIDPNMPSPTITARGDEKGGVVILHHPNNHRRMSVRETATVQSFPLGFTFYGSRTSGYRQVANAVPPLLAKAVAQSVIKCASGVSETGRRHRNSADHLVNQMLPFPDLV